MAKRYTAAEKEKIVTFVTEHDKEHGRGGVTAASKEFGVNVNSIRDWMGKGAKTTTVSRKKKSARTKAQTLAPPKSTGNQEILERMTVIQSQIDSLQGQFGKLKSTLP